VVLSVKERSYLLFVNDHFEDEISGLYDQTRNLFSIASSDAYH